jgi:type IV pilus assembly protein PilE
MNKPNSMNLRQVGGFSLIELLIAITIIGLLLGIAVPSYRDHLRRGAIEEALAEMSRGRVAIENYFLDNRMYTGAPLPPNTARFTFAWAMGEPTATTYKIVATGSGNVAGFSYTINETGVRTTDSGSWGTNTGCWIIRKGGTCGG